MIGGRRPLQGRKPGDRRVRVERPHTPYFRYTGPGQRTAKQAASAPTTGFGKTLASVRGYLFGRVLASEEELRKRWERQLPDVPLVIVESPYRAVISPVVAYLDILDQAWPPDKEAPLTIVVLPGYVARHWWDRLLYNQTAKRLKSALVAREHTVIADVPYRRGH